MTDEVQAALDLLRTLVTGMSIQQRPGAAEAREALEIIEKEVRRQESG
jgi:hypothetical protein